MDLEAPVCNNFVQPCRITATVGASNFCFSSFMEGILEFFRVKGMMLQLSAS